MREETKVIVDIFNNDDIELIENNLSSRRILL